MVGKSAGNGTQNTNNQLLGEMTSKVSFSFLVNISSALFGYIFIALANKLIGIDAYGDVIFALSFAGFFSFLTDLGFSKAHIKHISGGMDEGTAISVFAILKLILTGIFAVAIILALWIWEMMGGGYENPEIISIIYIVATYFIFTSIGTIFSFTYSARRDAIRYYSCVLTEVTMRMLAMIIVVLFALGVFGLAYTWMVAGVGYLITAFLIYRGPGFSWPGRATFFSIFRKYARFALPLSLSTSIVMGSQYFDKILLKLFFSSTEAALFFAPQRLLFLFLAIATSINLMMFPLLSEIFSRRNSEIAGKSASKALFFISLAIFPLAIFAFAFAEPLLEIYIDPEYLVATTMFRILIVANMLAIVSASGINLLLGIGKSRIAAKLGIAAGITVLVLDIFLIPPSSSFPFALGLGINGAAISLLIAGMIRLIGTMTFSYRLANFKIPKRLIAILLVAAISSIIPYYLFTIFDAFRFYHVIAYFLLNFVIYIGLIKAFGVITREEFASLLHIFSPRNFIKFLRS